MNDAEILEHTRRASTSAVLLRQATPALLRQFRFHANGYPTSVGGADGGSSTPTNPNIRVTADGVKITGNRFVDYDDDELGHDAVEGSTSVEAAVLTADPAVRAMRRYGQIMLRVDTLLLEGTNIAKVWLEGVAVKPDDGKEPANTRFCANHLKYGMTEARWLRHLVCQWCYGVHADTGHYPNKALCDLKATKGRVYDVDIERLMPKGKPPKPTEDTITPPHVRRLEHPNESNNSTKRAHTRTAVQRTTTGQGA